MALKVKIGADISNFRSEFKKVNKISNDTLKDFKELGDASKLDPSKISDYKNHFQFLSKSVKETRDKLNELKNKKKDLDEAFEKGKISQKDLDDYRKLVFKTETNLKKLEKQAKDTEDNLSKIGNKNSFANFKTEVGNLTSKFSSLTPIINVATKAIAGFATVAVATAGAILTLGINSGKFADEINTLSIKTGLSTSELQKFKYASGLIDVELETVTGSLTKLTKSMDNARNGSTNAKEAFNSLGIEVVDSNGQLKNRNEIFKESIKALGKIENETERDALAMQLFGKSASELTPLIKGGIDQLEKLGEEAEKQGLILSESELNKLNGIDDAVERIKGSFQGLGNKISLSFADGIVGAISVANSFIVEFINAIQTGDFSKVFEKASEIVKGILASLRSSIPNIKELLSNLVSNLVNFIKENSKDIFATIIDILLMIVQLIAESLPEIIALIPKLFFDLIAAIWEALPQILLTIVNVVVEIVKTIASFHTTIVEEANNFKSVIIESVINFVIEISQSISKVFDGIMNSIFETIGSVTNFFTSIVNKALELPAKMLQVGKDIVKGIWNGINSMVGWVGEKIGGFFGGIIDKGKEVLGIHSPSRVFAEIGKNMALGVDVGFSKEMLGVTQSVTDNISNVVNKSSSFVQNINYYGNSTSDDSIFKIRRSTKRLLELDYV